MGYGNSWNNWHLECHAPVAHLVIHIADIRNVMPFSHLLPALGQLTFGITCCSHLLPILGQLAFGMSCLFAPVTHLRIHIADILNFMPFSQLLPTLGQLIFGITCCLHLLPILGQLAFRMSGCLHLLPALGYIQVIFGMSWYLHCCTHWDTCC